MKSLVLFLLTFLSLFAADTPLYLDATRPIPVRVEDLLSRMTVAEKVGQINMPCVYVGGLGRTIDEKTANCRRFAEGVLIDGLGPGGGFFTLANTILHEGPRQQAEYFNELQRIATGKTRLKIPLLQTEEGTHGLMCSGGTNFPEGLAIGSSWDLDLVRRIYEVAAREGRAVGIHQLFTLVIEPYRDPRLGRNQEAYGEDPYLVSRLAEVIVHAVQGDDISAGDKTVAGLCHYPGQSEPVSGLERGAMEISERKLREVFLPTWFAGIKNAGALGVMATYPTVDGVPAHASEKLLTDILRGEIGFEGLVLGEGGGIEILVYEGLAPTQKEAGQLALKAGLDVGISHEQGYLLPMIESINEGLVSMAHLDRAVRRVLRLKFQLGLFEDPFVDVDHAVAVSHTQASQDLALEAAREGIVLLKNAGNLLPLKKDLASIAVIGPNADHEKNLLGDYTSNVVLQDVVTVLEGIRAKLPSSEVHYVKGCDVIGSKTDEIARAAEQAKASDVAVVVVGENEWKAAGKQGTSGEGYDVATLELTGRQQELVEAVYATGTPTVVVLINGRPLATRWIAANVPAIVEAWCPGEKGGQAVADVLFGDYNPSGKLTVTVPRHVGQLPVYYNHGKSKRHWIENAWGKPYADMDPTPLYNFGHGLSYTSYEYSNLRLSASEIGPAGKLDVRVDVKNTGARAGSEVVQLYIADPIATVATPVKELKGFARLTLAPGEIKTATFTLTPDHLALLDKDLNRVVESGRFEVQIGASSIDIRLRGGFDVAHVLSASTP